MCNIWSRVTFSMNTDTQKKGNSTNIQKKSILFAWLWVMPIELQGVPCFYSIYHSLEFKIWTMFGFTMARKMPGYFIISNMASHK